MASASPLCETATVRYPAGRTGTAAGYDAHRRYGEAACRPCTDAWTAKNREWAGRLTDDQRRARLKQGAAAARRYRQANPEKAAESKRRFIEDGRATIRAAKDRPCADCGVAYPYYVMQFDHLDSSTKDFNIGPRGSTLGKARLRSEIEKCEVVCANCHAERTHQRRMAAGKDFDE